MSLLLKVAVTMMLLLRMMAKMMLTTSSSSMGKELQARVFFVVVVPYLARAEGDELS